MQPIEAFKQLCLLSVFILLIGLTFLAIRWPKGVHATFSQHAAVQKKTIVYYIVLFILALPPLTAFFIFWFVPTFHLSTWFIAFAVLSELFQHSVTFIPEVGGWKTKWHVFLTNCSAALLVPMLLILLASSYVTGIAKIITLLGLFSMLSITAYFQSMKLANKLKYLMLLQVGYYGAFFIAILVTAYSY